MAQTNPLSRSSVMPPNQNKDRRRRRRRRRKSKRYSSKNKENTSFNPILILSQIAALQSIHYLIMCIFLQINNVIFASSLTIDRIFTDDYLNIWVAEGWLDNSLVLFSSVTDAILLAIIVEKAKKCLDFSVTSFLIHVIACTVYDGIPSTWDWWIVNVLQMIIVVLLGEYLCARKELREIPLLSL